MIFKDKKSSVIQLQMFTVFNLFVSLIIFFSKAIVDISMLDNVIILISLMCMASLSYYYICTNKKFFLYSKDKLRNYLINVIYIAMIVRLFLATVMSMVYFYNITQTHILPKTNPWFISLSLLLVVMYSNFKGYKSMIYMSELLLIILIAFIITCIPTSLHKIDYSSITNSSNAFKLNLINDFYVLLSSYVVDFLFLISNFINIGKVNIKKVMTQTNLIFFIAYFIFVTLFLTSTSSIIFYEDDFISFGIIIFSFFALISQSIFFLSYMLSTSLKQCLKNVALSDTHEKRVIVFLSTCIFLSSVLTIVKNNIPFCIKVSVGSYILLYALVLIVAFKDIVLKQYDNA